MCREYSAVQTAPDPVQPSGYLQDYREKRKRAVWVALGFVAVLIAVVCISFLLGRYPVTPDTVVRMLWYKLWGLSGDWTTVEETVVLNIRLPRILAAVAVGSALSVSGAAYQGIFKNPMVSPDILGASAGASVGAALALLLGWSTAMVQASAFVLGIGAVALAYTLSRSIGRGNNMVLLLVLCGMVVSTLFQAGVSIIKYLADPDSTLPEITYWLMGSISKVGYNDLAYFLIPYLIGVIPLLLLRWKLNVLSFGDEEAKALGVNTEQTRVICIVCATLLTAATVSISGTVGWVGLMIPHLVRFLVGPNYKAVLPLSLLGGAAFMLIVDNFCRCMLAYEIPLGILTSIIGGPFFVLILYQRKGEA